MTVDQACALLGVDGRAPKVVIAAAYKALLKNCHPDRAEDEEDRSQRERQAKLLGEAFRMLSDDAAAARDGESSSGGGGWQDSGRANEANTPSGSPLLARALEVLEDDPATALQLCDAAIAQGLVSARAYTLRSLARLGVATSLRPPLREADLMTKLEQAADDASLAVALDPGAVENAEALGEIRLRMRQFQGVVDILAPLAARRSLTRYGRLVLAHAYAEQISRKLSRGRIGEPERRKWQRLLDLEVPEVAKALEASLT
jgi:hypothetical protein